MPLRTLRTPPGGERHRDAELLRLPAGREAVRPGGPGTTQNAPRSARAALPVLPGGARGQVRERREADAPRKGASGAVPRLETEEGKRVKEFSPPPRYPRTPHWPWSPGNPPERRSHPRPELFAGREIVITEKLDGTNAALWRGRALTRNGGTTAPWLQAARKRHAWKTANLDAVIYGEDLLGVHSTGYGPMPEEHTFRVFARLVREGPDTLASWEITEIFARQAGMLTVPVLFRGAMGSLLELQEFILEAHSRPSELGGPAPLGGELEGVVVRIAESFPWDEFPMSVAKSVRENHVRSEQHWSRNWRRAEITGRRTP